MNLELMPARTPNQDVSGFGLFSDGDAGQAHVTAHRMLDQGRHELGSRLLGAWLEGRTGSGSEWTHLQWHMAVFELALGKWDAALLRFERHILPVAAQSYDALTDAPAMLWRLQLAAPRSVRLPWEPLCRTAACRLSEPCDPYVELHCLLALAGGRRIRSLDQWLGARPTTDDPKGMLLNRLGLGLRAFAADDEQLAAAVLSSAVPKVSELGGSHAQNLLFLEILQLSLEQAGRSMPAAA